ncbi:unnamed protein product, partial [Laminaria digitata]
MRMDKLTTLAQQSLAQAQQSALGNSNPEVGSLHVLDALIEDTNGPVMAILKKIGVNTAQIAQITTSEIGRLPTTSSGAGSSGREIMEILGKADKAAEEMGDQFISCEHLLLALTQISSGASEVLKVNGVETKAVRAAIAEIRKASGVEHINDPNAEGSFESLKKYGIDLTERARSGKLDPVIGRDEEIRRCMQVLSRRT